MQRIVPFLCGMSFLLFLDSLHAQTNHYDAAQLEYNLQTTVRAYDSIGSKNPKWDDDARAALTTYARLRSTTNQPPAELWDQLKGKLRHLSDVGCDDPLIRYLYLRFIYSDTHSAAQINSVFQKLSREMEASKYPEIRKSYVLMRTRDALLATYPKSPQAEPLLQKASSSLAIALADKDMAAREADQATDQLMSASFWAFPSRWNCYHTIEPALTNRWKDTALAYLNKGRGYLSYAWAARGNGYAPTVSDEGWKLMAERQEIAAQALETAWKLDPHDVRICLEMVRVEVGQHKGRERLELWFQRGMKLAPDDYDLCYEKIDYLRPRWYGSIPEMIAFGRECGTNTNWTGRVPLWRADAYYEALRELSGNDREGFWTRPGVWEDVRAGFERFFQLNPKADGWRHNYAKYAFLCEQWQEFLNQVALFPSTNYTYFGGPDRFNQMMQQAQAHVKK